MLRPAAVKDHGRLVTAATPLARTPVVFFAVLVHDGQTVAAPVWASVVPVFRAVAM
jgi:hypothetical protein